LVAYDAVPVKFPKNDEVTVNSSALLPETMTFFQVAIINYFNVYYKYVNFLVRHKMMMK
jgi:hypothetical protein